MNKNILFVITIFLLVSNLVSAQSLDNLDIKNGFRHFKLGSTPAQIKNIIKEENHFLENPDIVAYTYIGNDIDKVFFVETYEVRLTFYKNKLVGITISFGDYGKPFMEYEFNQILKALEEIYGKNWGNPNNNDGIILNGAIWNGKNVRLELLRLDFSKSKTNPKDFGFISGYISVFDKKLNNEMISSEF